MDINPVFKHEPVGVLAYAISAFIRLKRSQGLKYIIEENTLYRFSILSQNYEFNGKNIPQTLVSEWFKRRPNEKPATLNSRCSCVSRFLRYAADCGHRVHIPETPKHHGENYVPYIFTEREITSFFNACDTMAPYAGSSRHEAVPVLFRLLYCCGLRASEAANLKTIDVDIDKGILSILEPKNRKDRYVPMSKTLAAVMRNFSGLMRRASSTMDGFFFIGKYNEHITRHQVYKWFRVCLRRAGIAHRGKGLGPRVHDLRHTFCVHALKSMYSKGFDIYCSLPLLSTYVGHKSIYATQYYLKLTAEMYPELLEQITNYSGRAIPELVEATDNETY
jgi:integrase